MNSDPSQEQTHVQKNVQKNIQKTTYDKTVTTIVDVTAFSAGCMLTYDLTKRFDIPLFSAFPTGGVMVAICLGSAATYTNRFAIDNVLPAILPESLSSIKYFLPLTLFLSTAYQTKELFSPKLSTQFDTN